MTKDSLSAGEWEALVNQMGRAPVRLSTVKGDRHVDAVEETKLRPPTATLIAARPLLVGLAVAALAVFGVSELTAGFMTTLLTAVASALLGFVIVAAAGELAINRLQRLPRERAASDLLPSIALTTWEYLDTLWSHLTDRRDIGPLTTVYLERRRKEPYAAPDYLELRKVCAIARYVEERADDAWAEQGRYVDAHANGPPPPRSPQALVWFGGELPDSVVLGQYAQQQANWLDALARSSKEFALLIDHPGLVQVSQTLDIAVTQLRNFGVIHLRRNDHGVDAELARKRNVALTTSAVERDQALYSGSHFPWLEEARLQEAVATSLDLVRDSLGAVIDLYTALVFHAQVLGLTPAKPFKYKFFDDLDELETEDEAASRHNKQAEFERNHRT